MPLDTEALQIVRDHWTTIQEELIARVDAHYGVYDGRTFKADRWERWLAAHGIPWPRLASGALALDDDIFATWRAPTRWSIPCGSCAPRSGACGWSN